MLELGLNNVIFFDRLCENCQIEIAHWPGLLGCL